LVDCSAKLEHHAEEQTRSRLVSLQIPARDQPSVGAWAPEDSPSGGLNGLAEEWALLAGISAVAAVAGQTQKHAGSVRVHTCRSRPLAEPCTSLDAREIHNQADAQNGSTEFKM